MLRRLLGAGAFLLGLLSASEFLSPRAVHRLFFLFSVGGFRPSRPARPTDVLAAWASPRSLAHPSAPPRKAFACPPQSTHLPPENGRPRRSPAGSTSSGTGRASCATAAVCRHPAAFRCLPRRSAGSACATATPSSANAAGRGPPCT